MSVLLTYDEAAERLRVSRRTVERLVHEGRIRKTFVRGRPFILQDEIETYLAGTTRRR